MQLESEQISPPPTTQNLPHSPQLRLSEVVSRQRPLHEVRPSRQLTVPPSVGCVGPASALPPVFGSSPSHTPASQDWVAAHGEHTAPLIPHAASDGATQVPEASQQPKQESGPQGGVVPHAWKSVAPNSIATTKTVGTFR